MLRNAVHFLDPQGQAPPVHLPCSHTALGPPRTLQSGAQEHSVFLQNDSKSWCPGEAVSDVDILYLIHEAPITQKHTKFTKLHQLSQHQSNKEAAGMYFMDYVALWHWLYLCHNKRSFPEVEHPDCMLCLDILFKVKQNEHSGNPAS